MRGSMTMLDYLKKRPMLLCALIAAAVCALAYWDKKTTPDYIEIYSDGEDEEDAF